MVPEASPARSLRKPLPEKEDGVPADETVRVANVRD
jgi:hypothetical protein